MFKNYLTTAWRSIRKDKIFSVINIAGLAIGLAATMLIILYVKHENSFDLFHKNADRMFSMGIRMGDNGDSLFVPRLGYSAGPMAAKRTSSVASFLRIRKGQENAIIQNPAQPSLKFSEPAFAFADSNFLAFSHFNCYKATAGRYCKIRCLL